MSKAHASRWARAAERGDAWRCPYCGEACGGRVELGVHVRDACVHLTDDFIPPARLRSVTQSQLDADPRYAPLLPVSSAMCCTPECYTKMYTKM